MRFTRSFLTSTLLLASVSTANAVRTVTQTNWHTSDDSTNTSGNDSGSSSGSESDSSSISGSGSGSSNGSGSGQQYTTSTVFATNVHTVTACPPSVTDCPATAKTTYVTTETIIDYTTVCPVTESATQAVAATDVGEVWPTKTAASIGNDQYTTSTVLTTSVHTVTACPSSVKNCPASDKTTYVTTETIIDYTTVCPVTESATQAFAATDIGEASPTKTATSIDNDQYTTSTVFTTSVHTVTACPSSVKNCPASEKTTYVTTDTIIDYTTICPVTATETGSGSDATPTSSTSTSGSGSDHESGSGSGDHSGSGSGGHSGSGSGNHSGSGSGDHSGSGSGHESGSGSGNHSGSGSGDHSGSGSGHESGSGSGNHSGSGSGDHSGSGSGHESGSGSGNHSGSGSGDHSGSGSGHESGSGSGHESGSSASHIFTTGSSISTSHSAQRTSSIGGSGHGHGHGHGHSHSHHGSGASSSIDHSHSPRPSSTPLQTFTSGAFISPSRSVQRTSSTPVIKPSASASPSAAIEPLALYVQQVQTKRKRQTYNSAVLIGAGSLTASCADADRFYLTGGHLYDDTLLIAANKDASSAAFKGSSSPGPIRGNFAITDNTLSWSNSDFTNSVASFCVSNSTVLAIFSGSMPSGCTPVTIAAVKYSQMCPGGDATTSLPPISSAISSTKTRISSTKSSSTPLIRSATPSSTAIPQCSAKSDPELRTTVLPALDPSVDGSTLLNLSPSMYATLYYASPTGLTILQVTYYMLYPQVTLENAYKIATVTCSGDTLTVTVTTAAAFNIVSQWPTNKFILITNSGSCNSDSQRGVYMVQSYTTDEASLTITLDVTAKVWADVSETMEVAYGMGRVNSTNISYTPSCTASYPAAGSSTPTPSSGSVSYADLTPEEKNIVTYLTQNNTYDDNGNIAVTVPAVTANTTTPVYNPDSNSTQQAALEDALQNAGLPSPDSMWNQTASDLAGHCSNGVYVPATTVYTKRAPQSPRRRSYPKSYPTETYHRHRRSLIAKRSGLDDETWWKYLWEGACSDIVGDILEALDEELGALAELICDLKDLYDDVEEAYANRNAIECTWTGCYLEVVVATYWNFTYTASAEYEIPAQTLVQSSVGKLSCVDCGLSISSLEFVGSVMIATSTGKVMSAFMTPTMSWTGNLVMGLETTDAWSGEWTYNFDTLEFNQPVSVPGEFTITPSVLYSLGVQWSTTAAVDITAGASISVNSGTLYLDFSNNLATQSANWSPTVEYTYPVFSSAAEVSFIPIMRTSLAIAVVIENANYGQQPIYINSDTAIGFNAALVEDDGEYCNAGELEMTSYSSVNNEVLFTGGSTIVLSQSGDKAGQTKCFNVPNDIPTADEVSALRSVGAAFCTSYLGYVAPTSVAYAVSTRTGPSTLQTVVPTTISTTSTIFEYPTVTTVLTQTATVDATSYVTVAGSQSLGDSYMKKRALETGSSVKKRSINKKKNAAPQPTKAAKFAKRTAVAEPTLVSTWDASKISLACSQVATGTATTTFYTSTATAYSGSVVNTVYSTVDALGALKTETFSRIVVSQTATTVTGTQTATATTATGCPLQTQVSCFTISAIGPDHINGKQLYLSDNSSSPVWGGWGAGYEVGVFYLTCAGDLVALPSMDVLAPAQDMWVEFGGFASTTTKQTCSQDTSSGILSCGSGWYSTSPTALRYTDFRAYSGDWQPVWNDATNKDTLTPVVLTYNTVDCPCQY
ncbi:hypothetical protein N7494_004891 [Penicillium frequentans]|uniref:Uncharacterized protein n=1 Tax=Penicillium frequentans TaxID=3151616 RepID=A0AAD6GIT9_9EURO|nr:hypothetical protein N7494_004891 [Penicillium glabrum]